MLDREQLEAFATLIEAQSFEGAAAVLQISRDAVSQRLKALEETLATVLVLRNQPLVQTAAGGVLLQHVKALRLLEDATLVQLNPPARCRASVPVTLVVNADCLATWFPKVMWTLLRSEDVAIELISDEQDPSLERLTRGAAMGCLSTLERPPGGFLAQVLGAMEYRCYATPRFVEQHFGEGMSHASVAEAPAILLKRQDALHDHFLQQVLGLRIERYLRHCVSSPNALLDVILAGVGYGLAPCMQARGFVEDGELIDLAPATPCLVPLYWHHWAAEPPLSQAITRLVRDCAKEVLVSRWDVAGGSD
jgi:LysR family transcriptional regulator (chromosome initiation inhibitor)